MIFSGLICESKNKISIGRILLWIVFGIQIAFWVKIYLGHQVVIPESLTTVLEALLIYNFGKKLVPFSNSLLKPKNEEDTQDSLP